MKFTAECNLQQVQEWFRNHPEPFPIDIVVPISGGKDSQACLALAAQERDKGNAGNVIGLFCDTKFEHPWTYQHVEKLQNLYNVKILKTGHSSVDQEVTKYKRFPGGGARHCTSALKMDTSKKFYRALGTLQKGYNKGFEVWYGMRSSESSQREKRYKGRLGSETYAPHEIFPSAYPQYLAKLGVTFRLPILDWQTDEVLALIGEDRNPLYKHGFDRVGCFPCLAGGDKDMIKSFEFDDFGKQQRKRVQILEEKIGRSCFNSKIGEGWVNNATVEGEREQEDAGNGCLICAM